VSNKCAYCDRPGTPTKDHVWPECFLERFGREVVARFSVKARRVHGADYVVNDVCPICNSGPLSLLDTAFCKLYDDFFHELHDLESTVVFRYDFDSLARSLLRIAFNSARAAGSETAQLVGTRKYVIGAEPRPAQLAVFVELVAPTFLDDGSGGKKKVFPQMYRSAVTKLLTPNGGRIMTRIVAVNSFYFHLVLPREPMTLEDFEEAAGELATLTKGVVRLLPGTSEVTLKTSPQEGLRSFLPHLTAFQGQYAKFFEEQKRKRKRKKGK